MDVIHTAIHVSDLDEAVEFFVNQLGLDKKKSITVDEVKSVFIGGDCGEIQLRSDPEINHPKPNRSALDHIAISVEDVDVETKKMEKKFGHNVVSNPRTVKIDNSRVSFIEGPDGYILELVEDLE